MTRQSRRTAGDPLAGVERVLIDGSNLAHALARPSSPGREPGVAIATSRPAPRPDHAIVASLRAAFPSTVRVEVVFDGPGGPAKAAPNLFVGHSGRRPADRIIEEAVEAQLRADGPAGTWGILVVTDDRELRGLVQGRGARVAGTAWLAGRIAAIAAGVGVRHGPAGRSAGASIGHGRPPRRAQREAGER